MENIIYYFTGTGNSLVTARMLSEKLAGKTELRALTNYLDREEILVDAEKTVGFIFPIYGSDAPWPVKAAAAKMRIPQGVYLYAIGTCNERGGHCMDYFADFLKKYGYSLSYAKMLNMPGNCKESNREENEERLELMGFSIDVFAKNINRRFVGTVGGHDFPENTVEGAKAKYASSPLAQWRVDQEKCVGCGICQKLCPMGNISLQKGNPVFSNQCAACFGCFHLCPQQAIYKPLPGFDKERSRSRYCHPDVTWQDIAKQQERF